MPQDRLQYLLDKFFNGTCTMEEKQELALWVEALQDNDEWKHQLGEIWAHFTPKEKIDLPHAENMLKNIFSESESEEKYTGRPKSRIRGMYRLSIAAAAVIGILMALSIIYVNKNFRPSDHEQPTDLSHITNNITPGGNKAILVLSNGKKILLDSAKNGTLVQTGSFRVFKSRNGQVIFQPNAASGTANTHASPTPRWNTLRTPVGGQYQIDLPDGSRAWLNAASSIKFPSAFGSGDRQVEISGEVYFEIARDAKKPFLVKVMTPKGAAIGKVTVLGTAFNIKAYADETSCKTTLLEGKVKMENAGGENPVMLLPGQQAALSSDGQITVEKNANTDEAVAWKNGLFNFEGNDIQYVMREISRWYNVDVKYENTTSAHFMGTISRNVNISEVLKMLEMTGAVHFRIEGRTVTVLP